MYQHASHCSGFAVICLSGFGGRTELSGLYTQLLCSKAAVAMEAALHILYLLKRIGNESPNVPACKPQQRLCYNMFVSLTEGA